MTIVMNVAPWIVLILWRWHADRFASLNRFGDGVAGEDFTPWRTWLAHRAATLAGAAAGAGQAAAQGLPWATGAAVGASVMGAFYVLRETNQFRRQAREGKPGRWTWRWPMVGWGWDGVFDVPWDTVAVLWLIALR